VPHTPDFLGSFVGSLHYRRLSLKEGAHVVLARAAYRKFGASRWFFARCGIPQHFPSSCGAPTTLYGCPGFAPAFLGRKRWAKPTTALFIGTEAKRSGAISVLMLILGKCLESEVRVGSMLITDSERAQKRLQNFVPGLCLFLASLAAFAFALYPMYVIRPFREQKPAALERALWVQLHDKAILLAIFAIITIFALLLWRRAGWVARLLLLAPAMPVALIAAGAPWFNPFEQMMFHPYGESRYVAIQQAGVDAKDMVIVVTLGGESRAYPIREMGYHHIVNDRLHQLPIAVTY